MYIYITNIYYLHVKGEVYKLTRISILKSSRDGMALSILEPFLFIVLAFDVTIYPACINEKETHEKASREHVHIREIILTLENRTRRLENVTHNDAS